MMIMMFTMIMHSKICVLQNFSQISWVTSSWIFLPHCRSRSEGWDYIIESQAQRKYNYVSLTILQSLRFTMKWLAIPNIAVRLNWWVKNQNHANEVYQLRAGSLQEKWRLMGCTWVYNKIHSSIITIICCLTFRCWSFLRLLIGTVTGMGSCCILISKTCLEWWRLGCS